MVTDIIVNNVDEFGGGATFGTVGPYLSLTARVQGELDPLQTGNRAIADIACAPCNARGQVEYATDLVIVMPAEARRGNGRILCEPPNRGRRLLFSNLSGGDEADRRIRTTAGLGTGFPLALGFTVMWTGWEIGQISDETMELKLSTATAQHLDGTPIVEVIRDEFCIGTREPRRRDFRLSYEVVTLDRECARLTVRRRQRDLPEEVPAWNFVDFRSIQLPEHPVLRPGDIYEFHYRATKPAVMGVGFAATRDVVSHLRYTNTTEHLLDRRFEHVLAIGFSQSGRFLRDFIAQGFNTDEDGRRIFDGVFAHAAGAGGVFLNARFSQPSRTVSQHQDANYPESSFPFSTALLADPLTGKEAALLRGDESDPLTMFTNTSSEYWIKGASLLHTDPLGKHDIALPESSRAYLIAGTQHNGKSGQPRDRGPCRNPRNPHDPTPIVRALLIALDEWVTKGHEPPPSNVPTFAAGTLVDSVASTFPDICEIGLVDQPMTQALLQDWVHPPATPPRVYKTLVSDIDSDGNEVAGIKSPDIAVPLGTYTGWNVYQSPYPEGEMADRFGSFMAFARTPEERQRTNDPRRAIAERYRSKAEYIERVNEAVRTLLAQRLLLPEDAAQFIVAARAFTDVFVNL